MGLEAPQETHQVYRSFHRLASEQRLVGRWKCRYEGSCFFCNLGPFFPREIQLLLRVWMPVTESKIHSGFTLVFLNKGGVAPVWESREGSKKKKAH